MRDRQYVCNADSALASLRFWLRDRPLFDDTREEIEPGTCRFVIVLGVDVRSRFIEAGRIICSSEKLRDSAAKKVRREIRRRLNPNKDSEQ